jgi:hypothetical protein
MPRAARVLWRRRLAPASVAREQGAPASAFALVADLRRRHGAPKGAEIRPGVPCVRKVVDNHEALIRCSHVSPLSCVPAPRRTGRDPRWSERRQPERFDGSGARPRGSARSPAGRRRGSGGPHDARAGFGQIAKAVRLPATSSIPARASCGKPARDHGRSMPKRSGFERESHETPNAAPCQWLALEHRREGRPSRGRLAPAAHIGEAHLLGEDLESDPDPVVAPVALEVKRLLHAFG